MKKTILLTLALSLGLASCSKEEVAKQNKAGDQVELNQAINSVLLKEAPAEALNISEIRKTAKPGDEVTLTGEAIGGDNIFVEGRAIMLLGDPTKITSCDLIPEDECPTPWDVCCDDKEVIKASILTVQIVDENGKPVKGNLKGIQGLKELSKVTVTGTVDKTSTEANMLVNATGIFVHTKR